LARSRPPNLHHLRRQLNQSDRYFLLHRPSQHRLHYLLRRSVRYFPWLQPNRRPPLIRPHLSIPSARSPLLIRHRLQRQRSP
jgi:hypothetical protein